MRQCCYSWPSDTRPKVLLIEISHVRLNIVKILAVLIYKCLLEAGVFIHSRSFQVILILWARAGAYPSVEHLKGTSLGLSRKYQTTLERLFKGKQFQIFTNVCKIVTVNFLNIRPRLTRLGNFFANWPTFESSLSFFYLKR